MSICLRKAKIHLAAFCQQSKFVENILSKVQEQRAVLVWGPTRTSYYFERYLSSELFITLQTGKFFKKFKQLMNEWSQLTLAEVRMEELQLASQLKQCSGWRPCTVICLDLVLASKVHYGFIHLPPVEPILRADTICKLKKGDISS